MNSVTVTAVSHVGYARAQNQDRIVVAPWVLGPDLGSTVVRLSPPGPTVTVAVIDGMGGHAGGEVAAALAAEVVASSAHEVLSAADAAALAERANRAVYERVGTLPQLSGMGATLACLTVVGDEALVFNVGDSRTFADVDGYLIQLTTDDAGPGGGLTASLGGRSAYVPVDAHVVVEPCLGRRFLVASDGLFGHLDPVDLESVLDDDDETSVQRLLALALERGGPDNVSIVMVNVGAEVRA